MPLVDSHEFWVIFDTCTHPVYYRDVHNILAMPRGTVIRYDYRDKYLSEQAKRHAVNFANAPGKVLLVYGQKLGFMRGEGNEKARAPSTELRWIATRFGTMQAIPSTTGTSFYFDFSVEEYPKYDQDALRRILTPLIEQDETPFHKWISISDDLTAYNDLLRGEDQANWEAIVDRISADGMQFRDDSFWRLAPLNKVARPKLRNEVSEDSHETRQVASRYELSPRDECKFEASSHSLGGRPSTQHSRELKIDFDSVGPLRLEGPPSVDLRQYTAKVLKFRGTNLGKEENAIQVVSFRTMSDQTAWPDGANFDLVFFVSQELQATVESDMPLVPEARVGQPYDSPKENSEPSVLDKLKPWTVLQSAIQAVPAVRYALGVAGVAAAAAIAMAFFKTPGAALVGTVAVLVMMFLLLLFSVLTQAARGFLLFPALFVTWCLAVLFVLSLGLTVSSVFFGAPNSYPKLIEQFQLVKPPRIEVDVVEKVSRTPVANASVTLDGAGSGVTNAEGRVTFDGVQVSEKPLVATVSAAGFQASRVQFDSGAPKPYHVSLSRLPEAPAPIQPPSKDKRDQPRPTGQSAVRLNGTWQVVIVGDINNARISEGTFQFRPQPDGEVLVSANFRLDDADVSLSGTASSVASQVFVRFNAKTNVGGSWSGRADFNVQTATQMTGRFQAKNGDRVPVSLKRISQ